MTSIPDCVMALNGGSSSLKFALYPAGEPGQPVLSGKIERIGLSETRLTAHHHGRSQRDSFRVEALDHRAAGDVLLEWLATPLQESTLKAIGHRVVHGGPHYHQPQRITEAVLAELQRLSPYDPEHLPAEIALIELCRERFPDLPQIACFDTAFHRNMPVVARMLPLPRRLAAQGVQRYGFHGLSYAFLLEELQRIAGAHAAGRVILAHLGNGVSLAAVHDGVSQDTTMAFTPTAGVPMGTRSGDLDPGLVWYLARTEQMTAEQFHHMVNAQSGLLGVSERSSDIQDLLEHQHEDPRAADAIAMFCYHIKKCIGAFAAVLGGVETLVFSGGIGENAAQIRARTCEGLEFLGVKLDHARNDANEAIISADASPTTVRVIHTDEERMIAQALCHLLTVEASHPEAATKE